MSEFIIFRDEIFGVNSLLHFKHLPCVLQLELIENRQPEGLCLQTPGELDHALNSTQIYQE